MASVGPTFQAVYDQHKLGSLGWGASEHLRSDATKTRLYTHSAFSISGFSDDAATARQKKWTDGAAYVKDSIYREWGQTIGDRVMGKLSREGGPDLNKQVLRGDLEQIRLAIEAETGTLGDILDSLSRNGVDPATVNIVKAHLKDKPQEALDSLQAKLGGLLVKPGPNARIDHAALRADLARGDLDTLQVLAKHGIVAADQTPMKTSLKVLIADGPDRTSLTYDKCRTAKEISGSKASMHIDGDFFVLEDHGIDKFKKTGDKIHLSMHPEDARRGWDVVMPILLENKDTIKQFKVTEMERPEAVIRKAREGASTPLVDAARRVYNGAQITIYQHAPKVGGDADSDAFAAVATRISTALRDAGIRPGARPESDLMIPDNSYVSFRREIRADGTNLRPEDADYATHKEAMRERPLYQALVR